MHYSLKLTDTYISFSESGLIGTEKIDFFDKFIERIKNYRIKNFTINWQ